ncbi:MAG: peptidoglycan DD-metalloendopeptidase family protein [Pseudomonadota bacterium]|nr:peptidoglycan DD-metalloendopeptidase family protein [Pseudomonadota bacterium]
MRNKTIEQDCLSNGEFLQSVIMGVWFTFLSRRFFSLHYYRSPLIFCLLIVGCESTPHRAPVTDPAAAVSQKIATQPSAVLDEAGQRPNFYIIQKGDTLYSIALNHGIDQQDLAQWNNIQDPGAIHIGQQLNLSSSSLLAGPSLFPLPEPAPASPSGTVVPNIMLSVEEKGLVNTDKLKVEPKAFKLPYSEQAIALLKGVARAPATAVLKVDPTTEKNADTSISPVPPAAEAVHGVDSLEWIWPAKGKVLEGFSEITKGIDIAGKPGQAVSASAAGKVVYSGAGLRGYGKLIIIKHNNTYLSAYAHNSKLLVKEGQAVAKGQKIAEMGNTDAGLVKLHFEIRKNGKPVDPLKHLPGISG